MRVVVQPVGKASNTDALKEACLTLNILQTIWRFEPNEAISQRGTHLSGNQRFSLSTAFDLFRSAEDTTEGKVGITVGAFAGDLDLGGLVSSYQPKKRKGIVSEFDWGQECESFRRAVWIFCLSNLALRCYTGIECNDLQCLGYHSHKSKGVERSLLYLTLCPNCRDKLDLLNPYRVEEIEQLLLWMKTDMVKDHKIKDLVEFIPPNLPVLKRQIQKQISLHGSKVFRAYGLLLVMHFLDDLVPFIEGLMSLGARQESICLLVKPYPYGNRSGVGGYLAHRYRNLRTIYLPSLPPHEQYLKQAIEACIKGARSGKFIVIEDGGYVVPFMHKNYGNCNSICLGAVEQTTKGIRLDQKVRNLRIPVVSVAGSRFKERFEAPLVGKAIVYNVQRLLEPLGIHLQGKKALVVGYGAVGREVAQSLKDLNMVVNVADSNLSALSEASIRGYKVGEAEDLIKESVLIVGTTGGTPKGRRLVPTIGAEQIRRLSDGAILVSASSDQIEIDLKELSLISRKERCKGIGTWYMTSRDVGEDKYLVVGDGYPINFFRGQGIPNQSIDPILTQLLLGAIHLTSIPRGSKGIKEELADQLLAKNKVIEELLNVHRLLY